MNRLLSAIILMLVVPLIGTAQKVTYSDYDRDDSKDMNFEIIGKMNGNFLIYKNVRWRHRITILDNEMGLKENINLDFIPDKTFNVDFVTYPDYFYMIYQYQKKNILYCMAVKMDGNGKKLSEPQELDTTKIPVLADNKIYSTVYSEDKQKIVVFKVHKKNDNYSIVSMLYNSNFQLLHKNRQGIYLDDRRDNYDNYAVDNDGNFVFTKDSKSGNRESSNILNLVTLAPREDTFAYHKIDLDNNYIDEVRLKPDNLNKRYLVHSFYSKKSRGNIEGLFTTAWVRMNGLQTATGFIPISDSVRDEAKQEGQLRFALDDFFIRQAVIKKDGGYILIAEDYSTQTRNNGFNNWNRWDYLNSPNYYSSNSYYYYNRYYGYYRPSSSFNNMQSVRYYYNNILILNIDKFGREEWSRIIHKDQYDDDNDNYLSYSTMTSGGEIHFLFNMNNKNQIIADNSITPFGEIKRNPTLKSMEKGYEFMPRLSKQITARQIIVPCTYRGNICFAKVDLQ
jgi:hypothetical protein